MEFRYKGTKNISDYQLFIRLSYPELGYFCFLATYDNITRYSDFMFGNSAPLEHMMLFPEILEDDDENNEGDESDS